MSAAAGQRITLADVPQSDLERIARIRRVSPASLPKIPYQTRAPLPQRILPTADRSGVGVRLPGRELDRDQHKIGTKKPNASGLYDMLGNVMEWTLDQYAPYAPAPATNPWVKATAPCPHAVRGGAWHTAAAGVGCTVRVPSDPSWKEQGPQLLKSIWYMTDAQWLGFRLVRPASLPNAEQMYRAWNNGVALDPY